MADYYTQVSFKLPCTAAEREPVLAAINACDFSSGPGGELSRVDEFFERYATDVDPEDLMSNAEAEAGEDGVHIWSEECADLDVIAAIIQEFAPSVLPFGFTWGDSCSKARPDAFSGGYVLVTAGERRLVSADEGLRGALAAEVADNAQAV